MLTAISVNVTRYLRQCVVLSEVGKLIGRLGCEKEVKEIAGWLNGSPIWLRFNAMSASKCYPIVRSNRLQIDYRSSRQQLWQCTKERGRIGYTIHRPCFPRTERVTIQL